MADPLSSLRNFNVSKRPITEKGEWVCFGEYCWPKTTNTNYLIYKPNRDTSTKEYYTLECLLYFLKNVEDSHPVYVRKAASANIPVVPRPDRKDLLAYLQGETNTAPSIDKSAPIELPKPLSEVLKLVGEAGVDSKTAAADAAAAEDGPTAAKQPKVDDVNREREKFEKKLEERGRVRKVAGPPLSAADTANAASSSLASAMSIEKIEALKAKRLAKKHGTIIDAENFIDRDGQADGAATATVKNLLQFDSNLTKEILAKERLWRNRSTILQSTGKNFAKSILPMLQSIKSREEGIPVKKPAAPQPVGVNAAPRLTTPAMQKEAMQQQYNRYDQERFSKADVGFKIDTTGTYHGLTLKSVTEGPAHIASKPATPAPKVYPSQHVSSSQSPGTPKKRTSRTPIIIIPATTTSLITMNNAKAILQDLRFVDGKVSQDGKRENEVLIQRRKPDNTTVPYRVIDNPHKLMPDDWERVVAVFVQGPAWQFKGWPWDGNPVEIFARIKAFHLKYDENKIDSNVAKWSVDIIELSRAKRHLDRANLLKFWGTLDQFMLKHKHFLRY